MNPQYASQEPTRAEVDGLSGPTVIEFGAPWCGHCIAAQPHLAAALADHPELRRLGRSFRVKLWPTLIFFADGQEIARLVRPTTTAPIRDAIAQLTATTR